MRRPPPRSQNPSPSRAEPEPEPEPVAEAEPEPAPEPAPTPAAPAASGGESTSVKMPELGESVTEGTVTRWLKKVGDSVEVDEPLVEVSTDKVDTEIPSPVAGTLLSITAEEDDVVPVGGELGKIGAAGAAPAATRTRAHPEAEAGARARAQARSPRPQRPSPSPNRSPSPSRRTTPEPAAPADAAGSGDGSPYVTPLVRKLAAENGVDLASVKGTGVGGRIRKQDVLAAAARPRRQATRSGARSARGRGAGAPRPLQLRPLPRWRTCAEPRRRPTGSARSRPRRRANPCRPQRN